MKVKEPLVPMPLALVKVMIATSNWHEWLELMTTPVPVTVDGLSKYQVSICVSVPAGTPGTPDPSTAWVIAMPL